MDEPHQLNMHRAEIRQLKNGLNLWKENYIRTLLYINNLLIHFLSFDFVHNFQSMGNGQQIKLTWTPHLESHPYVRWRHHLWSSSLVLFVQFCTLHIHALISTKAATQKPFNHFPMHKEMFRTNSKSKRDQLEVSEKEQF